MRGAPPPSRCGCARLRCAAAARCCGGSARRRSGGPTPAFPGSILRSCQNTNVFDEDPCPCGRPDPRAELDGAPGCHQVSPQWHRHNGGGGKRGHRLCPRPFAPGRRSSGRDAASGSAEALPAALTENGASQPRPRPPGEPHRPLVIRGSPAGRSKAPQWGARVDMNDTQRDHRDYRRLYFLG